jgi:hypothetical protein
VAAELIPGHHGVSSGEEQDGDEEAEGGLKKD